MTIDQTRLKNARRGNLYPITNNKKYYTRHEELLKARSKTYSQNQFAYKISGVDQTHGSPAAVGNTYHNQNGCCTTGNTNLKPSNWQYGVQGAISNGQRLMNLRYQNTKR
jgi:hypothetical protein